jgi:hypothetical protein
MLQYLLLYITQVYKAVLLLKIVKSNLGIYLALLTYNYWVFGFTHIGDA